MEVNTNRKIEIIAVALLFLVVALLFGFYYFDTEKNIGLLKQQIISLKEKLTDLESTNEGLSENLIAEKNKNDEFADQIDGIADTVGDLEKLSKIDPELLQKYSKVFFLNEHYTPSELVIIDPEYATVSSDTNLQIHVSVWPKLKRLLEEARSDDLALRVASGYRSFGTQASLKSRYVVTFGAKTANQFSADQGYSEHQLGTTVDFTTEKLGAVSDSFTETAEYKWLQENAHRFGFILSYPADNGYYQFEPWHWRFVGTDLARDLYRDGQHFYDLDQREIDKYLVDLF